MTKESIKKVILFTVLQQISDNGPDSKLTSNTAGEAFADLMSNYSLTDIVDSFTEEEYQRFVRTIAEIAYNFPEFDTYLFTTYGDDLADAFGDDFGQFVTDLASEDRKIQDKISNIIESSEMGGMSLPIEDPNSGFIVSHFDWYPEASFDVLGNNINTVSAGLYDNGILSVVCENIHPVLKKRVVHKIAFPTNTWLDSIGITTKDGVMSIGALPIPAYRELSLN